MASTVLPNGIIIPEKFSRDWYADLYHNWQELDNLLGGGTPKDGTLTIQKNSTTVGTFSANQATNETVNITVPTATSELTNDSNFVESSDLATVATSGSYTDLSDKPTIPTVNNATLTIQQNGTAVDTFTANSSTDKTVNIQCVDLTNNQTVAGNKEFTGTTTAHDVIPSATDTYNLGGSSYQWNQAYIKSLTINGVACGDILTHNVSEFVGVTGAQTIGGVKTFSGTTNIQSLTINGSLVPASDSAVNLGISTKKWKSFNSVNPGALSLPGASVNVDTTNWVLDGSNVNIFTPASDGWLGIQVTDTVYDQMHYVFVGRTTGGDTYYQQNIISSINALWDNKYHGSVFIPVIKNKNYSIRCICSSIVATFYLCQGNV